MADEAQNVQTASAELAQAVTELGNMVLSYQNQKKQQEWQEYTYEDQKKWNSPANQRKLLAEAGYNPFWTDANINGLSQPQGVDGSVMQSAMSSALSSMSDRQRRKLDSVAQQIAFKQLELSEKDLDQKIKGSEISNRLVAAQANSVELENLIKDITKGYTINEAQSRALSTFYTALLQAIEAKYRPDQLQALIDQMAAGTAKTKEETKYIAPYYKLAKFENELKNKYYDNIDLPLAQQDIKSAEYENSIIDAVDELTKSVTDNPKASKGTKALVRGLHLLAKAILASNRNKKYRK